MLASRLNAVILAESSPVPAHVLWIATISLELFVVARGIRTKLFAKFPVFYTYVLFVFLQSVVRFAVYHWHPQRYRDLYWLTEFVGVVVGCGVLFEVYRAGLAPYPGTARLARNVLALVFAFAAGKALAGALRGGLWFPSRTTAELERNLRAAQAFAILGLVILLLAYSIPLGRNLRGILVGYGLFIASDLANLAMLASPGRELQGLWSYSQQIFYLVVLCIWAVSLWTPSPQPRLASSPAVAPSYKEVERKTRDRLKHIRIFSGTKKDR